MSYLPSPSSLRQRAVPQEQFGRLARHTQGGIKHLERFKDFMKERSALEIEYANKLRRLVRWYEEPEQVETMVASNVRDEENAFSIVRAFNEVLLQTTVIAGQHENVGEGVRSEVAQAMQDLAATLTDERKTALQDMKRHDANLSDQWAALDTSWRAYEKAIKEAGKAHEKFQTADADFSRSRADVQKKQENHAIKTSECMEAENSYSRQRNETLRAQDVYENELIPEVLQNLRATDIKRVDVCRSILRAFVELQLKADRVITGCLEKMLDAADSMAEDEETKEVVEKFITSLQIARGSSATQDQLSIFSASTMVGTGRINRQMSESSLSRTDSSSVTDENNLTSPQWSASGANYVTQAISPLNDPFMVHTSHSTSAATGSSDRNSWVGNKSSKIASSASKFLSKPKKLLSKVAGGFNAVKQPNIHSRLPGYQHGDVMIGDVAHQWSPMTPDVVSEPGDSFWGFSPEELMMKIHQEEEMKAGLEKLRETYLANPSSGDATPVASQLKECTESLQTLWAQVAQYNMTVAEEQLNLRQRMPSPTAASSVSAPARTSVTPDRMTTRTNQYGHDSFDLQHGHRAPGRGFVYAGSPNSVPSGIDMIQRPQHVGPSSEAITSRTADMEWKTKKRDSCSSFSSAGSDDHHPNVPADGRTSNQSPITDGISDSGRSGTGPSHTASPDAAENSRVGGSSTPYKGQLCTALYDFQGQGMDDCIPVKAGEELIVLERDNGNGWTRVRREAQPMDAGYVPTSYIENSDRVSS